MAKFIRVEDVNGRVYLLNVDYILQVYPTSEGYIGNSVIVTSMVTSPQIIQTELTIEELYQELQN